MSLRVLHTSDWHLGQHFMGKTRQAEHQAFAPGCWSRCTRIRWTCC